MNGLSELEASVLGLVWSEGPCTPYRVQQMIASSPSPHWSGSTGAIYPVFARLEVRGLVRSKKRVEGRRASHLYRVSSEGVAALRRWIGPPLDSWTVDIPDDPLRTRVRFIGTLPPRKRAAFLEEARKLLSDKLEEIRQDAKRLSRLDEPFAHAMARGAAYVTKARIEWIREVEQSLAAAATSAAKERRSRRARPRREATAGSLRPRRRP